MAFQPAPACAVAVMRYGYTSGGIFTHANVLNFKTTAGVAFTLGDLSNLADTLEAWFTGHLDGVMSTGFSLLNIELRGLASAESPYYVRTVGLPGVVAGDALPPNVAACVTMSTGLTGRSARGRMYWGGMSEVQQDGGALVSGVVTGLNDACAALLTALDGDGSYDLVVLSRFTGGAERPTANPLKVTEFALRDAVLDTQRRRINRLKT